ncbi:MAG TPA: AraC family transcriptional regulator [Candidatus Saccharimonadales bacterium]|nr:AraC family transcriptional regulator [Candidatus Saccharimonadales bacterium]
MKKREQIYEPHLVIREIAVPPGGEWVPRSPAWLLAKIVRGTGYCLQPQSSQELEAGAVILATGSVSGSVRASQLGGLLLFSFSVIPARLTGLITLGEQDFLAQAASRPELSLRVLPPHDPVAVKMGELCATGNYRGLLSRLNLLQLFVEAFGPELQQAASEWDTTDARERLRVLLEQTPSAELLEMSFDELARNTHCTPRHLSRIFHNLVGMSFRDKRGELRLTRARDLLANSRSKVVEVALESGYKSLSLFNLMFTRHFGTSPGRWRQRHRINENGKPVRKRAQSLAA